MLRGLNRAYKWVATTCLSRSSGPPPRVHGLGIGFWASGLGLRLQVLGVESFRPCGLGFEIKGPKQQNSLQGL